MTTVVADGRTLTMVADKQMSYHKSQVVKTWKVPHFADASQNWLIGGSGNLTQLQQFLDWWVAPTASNVPCPQLNDCHVLVMSPKGKIALYVNSCTPIELDEKFYSVGSGSDYAMGAMEAGADAKTAVKIASKRDPATGASLRILSLKEDT